MKTVVFIGSIALFLLAGCARESPRQVATPTAPEPTSTPTSPARAESTPTHGPAFRSTPTQVPTAKGGPQPGTDREGLWAGEVEDPRLAKLVPVLSFRVTPGEDPDLDLWHLEGGPVGLSPFRCTPRRLDEGWELANCTAVRGLPRGTRITAFVPARGESGLEVVLQLPSFAVTVSLTRVPQRDEPQASDNVSLIWRQPGSSIHSNIWAADGLVFAPRFDGRIEVLDAKSGGILSTASLSEAGGGRPHVALDVKARNGLLYVATVSNGVVVFDVSQPTAQKLVGQYRVFFSEGSPENFTNIHNIFLSPRGDHLYAINQSAMDGGISTERVKTDLRVIDVSDPTALKEVGRFAIDTQVGGVHDINVIERDGRLIAFLNYLRAGLWILDVTDPASMDAVGSITWDGIVSHSGWPFTLGDRLYYAHSDEGYDRGLTILDVTDLASPRVLSRFRTREGVSSHNVEVVDGIAYISYYIDGLRVVDLRDPSNPREVGHFDTVLDRDERDILQGAFGVHVHEDLVYVSDVETGTYAFLVNLD